MARLKVAVTVVLETARLLTVTHDPHPPIPVVPERPLPLNVTLTVSPGYAEAGVIDLMVGAPKAEADSRSNAKKAGIQRISFRAVVPAPT